MLTNLDKDVIPTPKSDEPENLTRGELLITITVFISFLLPLAAKTIHLPPVIGILLGVGITWLVVDSIKNISKCRTHLTASIENLVQKTDIASVKFFVGILLAVSALHTIGVLEYVSQFIYGSGQDFVRIAAGNVGLGLISSLLDNIPLTAIAISISHTTDPNLWVLLAIAVGTGGSLLPIGSVAGVIALGMVKELNISNYIKYGTIPAFVAFCVAITVWSLQTLLL